MVKLPEVSESCCLCCRFTPSGRVELDLDVMLCFSVFEAVPAELQLWGQASVQQQKPVRAPRQDLRSS